MKLSKPAALITSALLTSGLLLSSVVNAADKTTQHACEFAEPADIAKVTGVETSAISEAEFYQSRSGRTTTCEWKFNYPNGMQGLVQYRKEEKSPNVTNPDFYANNLQRLVDQGRKMGSKTINYSKYNLAGISTGALSEVSGNRFTKELDYTWHEQEDRRQIVSLSRTMSDDGTLIEPSTKDLEPLVQLFK